MKRRAPGARPEAWGAVLLALCICPSAGCAGDAPASASTAEPFTQLPSPSPATDEEPAPGESASEPAEMSSTEPSEASSSEPAEAHSASPKPVHHHHRRKRKPRPPPATTVSKPAPAHTAAPPPKPTTNIRPIGPEDITSVLGKMVVDASGNDLGRVVNVLVDAKAHVRAVVVDFGGFLGVGNRQIAVNWELLEFHPGAGDKSLVLKVSRDQVENAPSFQESAHPDAVEGTPAPPPAPAAPARPAAAAPAAAAAHPAAPAPAAPPHPAPPAPAHSGK